MHLSQNITSTSYFDMREAVSKEAQSSEKTENPKKSWNLWKNSIKTQKLKASLTKHVICKRLSAKMHCKCLQSITGCLQVFPAISMEKGCKNHRETLYSSKGKIVYVVGKPCNIYRLWGNPITIMGFPRNL